MSELASRHCVPCAGGAKPLSGGVLSSLHIQVDDWAVVEDRYLERQFAFPDFRSALAFVNEVGELAEAQNHHPDIFLAWGKVEIKIWTHKINGLTENDFILAAKIDRLPR